MNHQHYLEFFRTFSVWLESHEHADHCMWGHVVQSGPLEGNKYGCSCGLLNLQQSVERIIQQ